MDLPFTWTLEATEELSIGLISILLCLWKGGGPRRRREISNGWSVEQSQHTHINWWSSCLLWGWSVAAQQHQRSLITCHPSKFNTNENVGNIERITKTGHRNTKRGNALGKWHWQPCSTQVCHKPSIYKKKKKAVSGKHHKIMRYASVQISNHYVAHLKLI